jgi:hypothetical protein
MGKKNFVAHFKAISQQLIEDNRKNVSQVADLIEKRIQQAPLRYED